MGQLEGASGPLPSLEGKLEALTQQYEHDLAMLEALRLENARLRAIVDHTTDVIYIKDREVRYRMVNPTLERLLELPLGEILGRTQTELFPVPVSEAIDATDRQVIATGEPSMREFDYQGRYFHAGKFPYRSPTGEIEGVVGITRELTDLRLAERDANKQREMLERIFEDAPIGIAYLDRELVFQRVNGAYCRMWDMPEERFLGRDLYEIFPRAGSPDLMDRLLASSRPLQVEGYPYIHRRDHGLRETFWDISFVPMRTPEGELEGLMVLTLEVSDRIQRERHRKEQLESLQALDRLKSQFVSAVSHELRTPLTTIKGFTEFLEDRMAGPLTSEQQDFVGQIGRSCTRLQALVDDLLDYAQMDAGQFRLVLQPGQELTARVREVIESLRPQAQEVRIELVLEVGDEPLVTQMDPLRVSQVLLNLIGNAIKFAPGGRVVVRASTAGPVIRCEVQDSGIGIRPEDQTKLFKPFSQVDSSTTRRTSGTGLGLSICKSIVEAHGGEIGVTSTPHLGSTFWFTLPLVGADGR